MRITNNMIAHGFLNGLNKSLVKQDKYQEQLADGQAIHRPSDDPIKVMRSLRFSSKLQANEQYEENVKDALSWMNTTDGAISQMSSIMMRVKELTIQAAQSSTDESYEAIATEIDGLISVLVDAGNTKLGDQFVFSGQADKTQPFVRVGDVITYNGDTNKISVRSQDGAASPDIDSVNVNGEDIFGQNLELLNHLTEIKQHLQSGSVDIKWLSNVAVANIDDDYNNLLLSQTKLGARMSSFEMTLNMLQDADVVITGDLANNNDVDIAKAIVELKESENVYNASLAIGSRLMTQSLVDFLS